MREIKFRAWDKEEERWCQASIRENGIIFNPSEPNHWKSIPIIMQFTGLKDKNGVEVYEGDIVRWLNPMQSKENYSKNPYAQKIVKWGKESCSFNVSTIDNDYEVIGNVYEPELLKGD